MNKLVGLALGAVLLSLVSGCTHYGGGYYVDSVAVEVSDGYYYDYHPYYYYHYRFRPYYHPYRAPYWHHRW